MCVSVCTEGYTDIVLLYNVASHGNGKVYNYFKEGLLIELAPRKETKIKF